MADVSNVSADLKIISTFPFSVEARATLREAAGKDVLCITNTDELLSRLREAEVLCSYWIPNDWRILAPRLRWLQYSSGGVDELLSTVSWHPLAASSSPPQPAFTPIRSANMSLAAC